MQTCFIKTESLIPYKNHKFRLYDDDRLSDLKESLQENGILSPVIVRPAADDPSMYEILCGHNRVNAATQLGWYEIPAVIKNNLPDDEAAFIVAESNLIQRSFSDMSMSERAFVIKDYMDALRSLNKRGRKKKNLCENVKLCKKINLSQVATNNRPSWAKNLAADKYSLSPNTVYRYLRIAELPKLLLNRLDVGDLKFLPAVELSYMTYEELNRLASLYGEDKILRVSLKKAKELRDESEHSGGKLSVNDITAIVAGDTPYIPNVIRLIPQVIDKLAHYVVESDAVISGIIVHYLSLLDAGLIEDKFKLLPGGEAQ